MRNRNHSVQNRLGDGNLAATNLIQNSEHLLGGISYMIQPDYFGLMPQTPNRGLHLFDLLLSGARIGGVNP